MSLPAVADGLQLDERVVRRHVARLEALGWLERAPWVWGEGSIAWLTRAGVISSGLGAIRPVKAPPRRGTVQHAIAVGWSAAHLERRGHAWFSARELAADSDTWAIRARAERGWTKLLPDVMVWDSSSDQAIALIVEAGGRRDDRQRVILEAWRDAIAAGRYAWAQYDCADDLAARRIRRLAVQIGLTASHLSVVVRPTPKQPAGPTRDPAG